MQHFRSESNSKSSWDDDDDDDDEGESENSVSLLMRAKKLHITYGILLLHKGFYHRL